MINALTLSSKMHTDQINLSVQTETKFDIRNNVQQIYV